MMTYTRPMLHYRHLVLNLIALPIKGTFKVVAPTIVITTNITYIRLATLNFDPYLSTVKLMDTLAIMKVICQNI